MGYTEALIFIPPICFIPAAILLGICFAVMYAGKNILSIEKEEVTNKKGSFLSLVIVMWMFNAGALFATFFVMLFVSSIPFFHGIHSEWGIAQANAYVPARIYIACIAFLHAALFSFSYIYFKNTIKNKSKRVKLFIMLAVIPAILWAIIMGFLFRIF